MFGKLTLMASTVCVDSTCYDFENEFEVVREDGSRCRTKKMLRYDDSPQLLSGLKSGVGVLI